MPPVVQGLDCEHCSASLRLPCTQQLCQRHSFHFDSRQNERGVSPLGVAVGFNQTAMVTFLLGRGANIMQQVIHAIPRTVYCSKLYIVV
jgi:ankyrin repeat protein